MIVLLQARCSSARFPNKVLKELQGVPLILFQISRIISTPLIEQVIVLTSQHPSDNQLCELLESRNITYFRGELFDVNSRFRDALAYFEIKSGLVMRLTADCPLICPEILNFGIKSMSTGNWDYLSNTVSRTFPDGLDFEIFDSRVFQTQPRALLTPYDKEHVTPYFYNNASKYSIGQVLSTDDYSSLRITVDFKEDLSFISDLVGQSEFNVTDGRYSHILNLYNSFMLDKKRKNQLNLNQRFSIKKYTSLL